MRLQRTLFVWKIMMIGLAIMLGGCGLPAGSRVGQRGLSGSVTRLRLPGVPQRACRV
jgi:hypothetical protein